MGLAGAMLYVHPGRAAASSPDPSAVAQSAMPDAVPEAPPVLFARTIVPATPVMGVRSVSNPPVVAQSNLVRVITPGGSQPGMLWVIAIGAVLCRFGARVLRV